MLNPNDESNATQRSLIAYQKAGNQIYFFIYSYRLALRLAAEMIAKKKHVI